MPKAVVEDWDEFRTFMAAQPLCQWSAQKQRDMARGLHQDRQRTGIHSPPPPKNDNADLAAALASMA